MIAYIVHTLCFLSTRQFRDIMEVAGLPQHVKQCLPSCLEQFHLTYVIVDFAPPVRVGGESEDMLVREELAPPGTEQSTGSFGHTGLSSPNVFQAGPITPTRQHVQELPVAPAVLQQQDSAISADNVHDIFSLEQQNASSDSEFVTTAYTAEETEEPQNPDAELSHVVLDDALTQSPQPEAETQRQERNQSTPPQRLTRARALALRKERSLLRTRKKKKTRQ
jgi:hypothetical protein